MSKALLLVFVTLIPGSFAFGHGSCRLVFTDSPPGPIEDPLFHGAKSLAEQMTSLRSSWGSERSLRRESHKIQSELDALRGRLSELRARQDPSLIELLDQWASFQAFWQAHVRSWERLTPSQKRDLRPAMEVALALGTRHLVVFLESPNYAKWKIDRLLNILKTHTVEGGRDSVELALFVLSREIQKSYSLWDFAKCRY